MKNKLVVLDFYNYLYRAFYGIRPLHTKSGQMVNAVYGMATMIQSILRDQKPTHFLIVEEGGSGWRKEAYQEYKNNRSAMPTDLSSQIVLIKRMLDLLNIKVISVKGQEADDVIASVVQQCPLDEVYIASSDKDLFQMVSPSKFVLDTMKHKTFGEKDVEEKFGVLPYQIPFYLSLVGDTSDNVPGAKGIGEKTASKLLVEYGSIDGIFDNIEKIKGKVKDNLINSKESIYLSFKLVSLNKDLNTGYSYEEYPGPSPEALNAFFESLDMKSLVGKFDVYGKKP